MSTPTVVETWLAAPFGLHGAESDEDHPDDHVDDDQPDDEPGQDHQPVGRRAVRQRAEQAEARLVALQRREVTRLAAEVLAQPGDVLDAALGGVDLDDLLDEDGVPDPDAVREAAEAVATRRPGLALVKPRRSGASLDGGAREAPPRAARWSDLIGTRR